MKFLIVEPMIKQIKLQNASRNTVDDNDLNGVRYEKFKSFKYLGTNLLKIKIY